MRPDRQRRWVLAAVLAVVALVTTYLLREVLWTVFFAVTVAYVLLPVRDWLVDRGLGRQAASAVATTAAFLAGVAVLVPLALVVYRRRRAVLDLLRRLPEVVVLRAGGFSYRVELADIVPAAAQSVRGVAIDVARAAPVIALKAALFAFVLYALLLYPGAPGRAIRRLVPVSYHDVLETLHERVTTTLYAIYVLQAATAVATFAIAFVVFSLLGYDAAFSYAVVAGVLQFVPIVGPSILIVLLAAVDLSLGAVTRAVLVLVVGLPLIGFLPDATVRPKLAEWTAELPGSVYFIGFTGGVLSVGAVGFIAGPLAVALLASVVRLVGDNWNGATR
ncbi:AI-2E family transporter [Halorarius halobius]|uniref:AI-2E family transporter n=1 Tax=Halorarius halobius TaxID=2962671 RepID=UPI0020CC65E1|nr:AI-2E family transporter [Halorarius halobius]